MDIQAIMKEAGLREEDLVAIRVAHHEQQLKARLTDLEAELVRLDKDRTAQESKLEKVRESEAKKAVKPHMNKLMTVLKAVGYSKCKYCGLWHNRCDETHLTVNLQFTGPDTANQHITCYLKPTEQIKKAAQELGKTIDRISEVTDDIVNVQTQLVDIASQERLGRAQIALNRLQNIPAGRQLFDAMTANKMIEWNDGK